jgi:hypothetical protein
MIIALTTPTLVLVAVLLPVLLFGNYLEGPVNADFVPVTAPAEDLGKFDASSSLRAHPHHRPPLRFVVEVPALAMRKQARYF